MILEKFSSTLCYDIIIVIHLIKGDSLARLILLISYMCIFIREPQFHISEIMEHVLSMSLLTQYESIYSVWVYDNIHFRFLPQSFSYIISVRQTQYKYRRLGL